MTLRVEAAGAEHVEGLTALFDAAACACHCRYWHFEGNKNAWLDRCASRPEENAAELASALRADEPSARGLVALEGDRVIGWMKLARRADVPKLRNLPVYRSRDLGDETTTFSVACFLVHPSERGRGVARALVEAAEGFARTWGAEAVEAYPRRSADRLYPEEVWQGPEALFAKAGFEEVLSPGDDAARLAYPVLRKVILR